MSSASGWLGLRIACAIALVSTTTTRAAAQEVPPEPPTAIEEAIIEHACGALHPAGSLESTAYLDCRQNQLLSLRTDFGRDLRRLSPAQRRTIDSACSGLRAPQGQDAYVECLTARLATMRPRTPAARTDAPAAAATDASTPPAAAPPAVVPAVSPASRSWMAPAILVLVVVGAGGAFLVVRGRRAAGTCRTCGARLVERGDLCQKCRHEAAELRRRATAERAAEERAREEEQQRLAARDEEQRQQRAADEEARRRELEEAEQRQRREREDAERRREEEARRRRQGDAAAADDEFDPYAVLGVPREASAAEIEGAYAAARKKYDLDLVADMGAELQEHFKRKAEAVERAHDMLAPRQSES